MSGRSSNTLFFSPTALLEKKNRGSLEEPCLGLDAAEVRWGGRAGGCTVKQLTWNFTGRKKKKIFKKNEKGKQKEVVREEIKNHDRAAWANTLRPRRAVVSACVHVVTLLSCAFLKPLLPFCRSISNSITTSLAQTVFFPLSLSRFSKRLKTIFCKPGKKNC